MHRSREGYVLHLEHGKVSSHPYCNLPYIVAAQHPGALACCHLKCMTRGERTCAPEHTLQKHRLSHLSQHVPRVI